MYETPLKRIAYFCPSFNYYKFQHALIWIIISNMFLHLSCLWQIYPLACWVICHMRTVSISLISLEINAVWSEIFTIYLICTLEFHRLSDQTMRMCMLIWSCTVRKVQTCGIYVVCSKPRNKIISKICKISCSFK